MHNKISIGIFSGSSLPNDISLISKLSEIGNNIDTKKFRIIYGGGEMGTMGIIPKSFHKIGGEVKGLTINNFKNGSLPWKEIEYENIYIRQTQLIKQSDILLVCPGGTGTLFELTEILVLNSMGTMHKPIFLFNYENFFNPITEFLENSYKYNFISSLKKLNFIKVSKIDILISKINETKH